MLQFFKYIIATIFGLFIFSLILIFIFIGIFAASTKDAAVKISDNSVLKIVLDRPLSEREPDHFMDWFKSPLTSVEPSIGLLELRQVLKKAKSDPQIQGIYLEPSGISGGYAMLQEVRNALIDFKTSGKYIISYGEFYSEKAYYLASVSDKIFLPPTGMVEFNGLETELMFFKGTFNKLGIKPEVFRVGNFKSAVEPFILDRMSDSNRVQISSFVNSVYNETLKDIATSRGIDFDKIKNISDSMLVRDADDAKRFNLITDLSYQDMVDDFLRRKTKTEKDEKIKFVSHLNYYSNKIDLTDQEEDDDDENQIAVIFASGSIYSGSKDMNNIGSENLIKEIRKARLDDDVKAIVLRVNSPGGSALASDVIWREVELAKAVKPVIASMSDVAASGGYYIAMACDTIVAQPTSITGSIGVFGLLFNAEDFLEDKLGITTDRVNTGKFSDLGSPTRPITMFERKIIQKEVNDIYEDFTSKAAKGRDMSLSTLKNLASGRVWSGAEAKNNGLVDVTGGLDVAINIAVTKAKLKKHNVKYLPEQKNHMLNRLFSQLDSDREDAFLKNYLGRFYAPLSSISELEKYKGVQALLPFEIIIK